VSNQNLDPVVSLLVAFGTQHMSQPALLGLLDDEKCVPEVPVVRSLGGSILPADLRTRNDD
jgi:hypothetical protein